MDVFIASEIEEASSESVFELGRNQRQSPNPEAVTGCGGDGSAAHRKTAFLKKGCEDEDPRWLAFGFERRAALQQKGPQRSASLEPGKGCHQREKYLS